MNKVFEAYLDQDLSACYLTVFALLYIYVYVNISHFTCRPTARLLLSCLPFSTAAIVMILLRTCASFTVAAEVNFVVAIA